MIRRIIIKTKSSAIKLKLFLLLGGISIFLESNAYSQSKLILGDGEIKPWAYHETIEGKQVAQGIVEDISKEIEKELKIDIETWVLPYDRLFSWFVEGRVDANISIYNPAIKDEYDHIETPLTTIKFHLYSRSGYQLTEQNIEKNTKIGIMRGSSEMYDNWRNQHDIQFTEVEAGTFENLLQMLELKRIEGAIVTKVSFNYLDKTMNLGRNISEKPLLMFEIPWFFKISKNSKWNTPEIRERINQAIINLKNQGKIEDIIDKHSKK